MTAYKAKVWDGSQWVDLANSVPDLSNYWSKSEYPGRNLVYNGAMQIAQRGTSGNIGTSTSGYFSADRWQTENSGSSATWTQSVETESPTGQGFTNSLKMLVGVNDNAPTSSAITVVRQRLEGFDVQRLMYGSSNAQQLTLSFWVIASTTGTYVAELRNASATKHIAKTYTINSTHTWQKISLTFSGDTVSSFTNSNALALEINFWLVAGSSYKSGTLPASWASVTNANRAAGQVNLAQFPGNYWQITGVQLEPGPNATSFEFEDYGTTLLKCQRYYEKTYELATAPGTNTGNGYVTIGGTSNSNGTFVLNVTFAVTKRTSSYSMTFYTLTGTSGSWNYERSGASGTASMTIDSKSEKQCRAYFGSGTTTGYLAVQAYGHWIVSDEL